MDILWQILQWIAAVGEIFLGYYAVEVFTKRGMLREYKWYFYVCAICIGTILAINRHWDVGLLSFHMLILQNIAMSLTVIRKCGRKKLFCVSVVMAYNVCNALIQLLFNFFMLTYIPGTDIRTVYINMGIYRVSCYYLALAVEVIVLHVIKRVLKKQYNLDSFYMSFLLYGTAGVFLIIALQGRLLDYGKNRGTDYIFFLQFILAASFFILLGKIKSIEIYSQLQILDLKNRMLEKNYQEMKQKYQNHVFTFHDLKNHLIILENYCKSAEMENAIRYIENIRKPILQKDTFFQSGNEVIDIIINVKSMEVEQKGIKGEFLIEPVNNIKIEDNDLCVILGNLMDNAIEACEFVEKEKAWISVKIHQAGDMLQIHIANSCLEQEKGTANIPLRKKTLRGYGIQSVKSVVEKYEGLFKWEKRAGVFTAKVTIFNAKGTS